MKQDDLKIDDVINCLTGKPETVTFKITIGSTSELFTEKINKPLYSGPGLIDLQINGINGIDFNNPSLSQQDLINTNLFLLSTGVTTFFPTIVTNSDDNILKMLATIHQTCRENELLNSCVGGIHLEGPFISPQEGAKGAHNQKYIKAPDWGLFTKFQNAAGGRIKIVTLAPEWEGSYEFIENCRKQNIIVSIGHSLANPEQIQQAVKAGAGMSTHLGNAVPLLLQRHPNIIWEQLANEKLYTCLIADGIHVPDSFIKVVMKTKASHTLIVSDATLFAGMPPGEYENNIGGNVILDAMKRVSMKDSPGLLAGAGKSLLENIEYLIQSRLTTLGEAWQMATVNVANMLAKNSISVNSGAEQDKVLFTVSENGIEVVGTTKGGLLVHEWGIN